MSIKIFSLVTLWRRPILTDAILAQLETVAALKGIDLEVVCVGSEGAASHALAERHGFHYVEHPNQPLGAKHNAGLNFLRDKDFTHLMVIGSDDLINNKALIQLTAEVKARPQLDLVGFRDMYVLSCLSSRAMYWGGYSNSSTRTIGAGRLVRRKVVEELGWQLWKPSATRNLDSSMMRNLKNKRKKTTVSALNLGRGSMLCDVKSAENIWSFTDMGATARRRVLVEAGWVLQHFNSKVRATIGSLLKRGSDPASKLGAPKATRQRWTRGESSSGSSETRLRV